MCSPNAEVRVQGKTSSFNDNGDAYVLSCLSIESDIDFFMGKLNIDYVCKKRRFPDIGS